MAGNGDGSPYTMKGRDTGKTSLMGKVLSGNWDSIPEVAASNKAFAAKRAAKKGTTTTTAPVSTGPDLPPLVETAPQAAAMSLAPTPKKPQMLAPSPAMGHGGGSSMADMFDYSNPARVVGPRNGNTLAGRKAPAGRF